MLVLSSSLQFNFSSILVQFRYNFGLEVHLITYIGQHFLGFSWSKAQRKGMYRLNFDLVLFQAKVVT